MRESLLFANPAFGKTNQCLKAKEKYGTQTGPTLLSRTSGSWKFGRFIDSANDRVSNLDRDLLRMV